MKIPKDKSEEKQAFAINLFKKLPPETKAAVVNRAIAERFGSPLRLNKLYRLRDLVRGPVTKA